MRVPVAPGVKVMLIMQLFPAFTDVQGLFEMLKSFKFVPPIDAPETLRVAVPVFCTVTFCAELVLPTNCPEKVRGDGDNVAAAAGPLPVRLTVCGLFPALSVIVSVPVRVPDTVGVNVTLMVQLPFAATEVPHVLFGVAKSPEVAMLVIVTALLVKLLSVTDCGELVVLRAWPVKLRLFGFTETDAVLRETVSRAKSVQTLRKSVQALKLNATEVMFAPD